MSFFVNKQKNAIIGVPLKCGYSTMKSLTDDFSEVKKAKDLKGSCDKQTKFFCLVREPRSRLESFFFDKLRKSKGLQQYCQQALCDYVSAQDILNGVVSFETFIRCVQKGYNDLHVRAQFDVFDALQKIARECGASQVQLLSLRDEQSLCVLQSFATCAIGRHNSTESIRDKALCWAPEHLILFLKSHYAKDYRLYDEYKKQIDNVTQQKVNGR